jgi:ribosome modulation factor
MATLEQIIEEARALPAAEQHRLRTAIEELTTNSDELAPYRTREAESAWVQAHRDEFLDQWVVLDGNHLVAHGTDARTVYEEARAQGISTPYLVHVTPKLEAYLGGW